MDKKVFNTKTVALLAVSVIAIVGLIIGMVTTSDKKVTTKTKGSGEILDSFYKYMSKHKETVIYYGSSTCSYCSLQTPIMKQIKEDYKVDYLYVDASKLSKKDQKEILKVLDIKGSTPTIAVVKNDDVIDVNVGYMDGNDTVEFLKKNKILDKDATYKPEENLTMIDFAKYKELVVEDALHVIVIGQTTCSHCIAVKPVLSRVAGNNNIEINYLNITEMNESEQSELVESLKIIGYADADNLGTPLILITKNNHLEGFIEGENPPSYFTREFKKYGVITE